MAEAPTRPPLTEAWPGSPLLFPGSPWPAGHVLLDDFEVRGVLGQGGMGVVYHVVQRSTGQDLAVKRARLADPGMRRRFLAELQLWLDLPPHPHLAACRFFRTVADEVVIFMDLAEGGSLAERIARRSLVELRDLLDVAIQVGEGLHELHECGLVHQDVKPANVLMSANGVARVSDFGLARARARLASPAPPRPGQSALVSSGAMTPAYCSPEQSASRPVSRRTDVWSWGVLVLEMFVGKAPCCEQGGPAAAGVLARCLQGQTPSACPLPAGAAEVLARCFRDDPNDRWPTLAEAIDVLVRIYRDCVGSGYPRARPSRDARRQAAPAERPDIGSGRPDPPRRWLKLAFQEAGRDPTEADAVLPPPAASSKAQAVADLSAYEEARQMLQRLVDEGRADLAPRLAELRVQKALVHLSAGDSSGAMELFDQAVSAWQEQVHGLRRHEYTPGLVNAWLQKASALRVLGDNEQAVALCEKVTALYQGLTNRRARRDLRDDLAGAYLQKGLALRNLGRPAQAGALFDRAIDLWRCLVEKEGLPAPANDLAQAYLSKASVLSAQGEPGEALALCDKAILIRRRLARSGRPDQEADLARALSSKAGVLRAHDRARDGLALYEQAVACWRRLVEDLGRDDLAHELARAYLSRANADRSLGETRLAAEGCSRAAAIWERLVHQEGRRELTLHLARAYLHRSNALRACGEMGEAVRSSDLGIALWERLVLTEGRRDLGNDLARAWAGKANLLRQLGQPRKALELFDRAQELRSRLVKELSRQDAEGDGARDAVARAEVLVELRCAEAKQELTEAVERLEEVARRTRRKDLDGALFRAHGLLRGLSGPDA
jgi:serine/threonine protein kinase